MRIILSACLLSLAVVACGEVVPVGGSAVDANTPPEIQSIAPDHGPVMGGTTVTVTGTGFQSGEAGDAQVVVGGFLATDTTVVDDGTITFTAPAGVQEGATVDVTLFNQNGHATLPASYRYNEQPVVISISPERGRGAGGTSVTIVGRGFVELEAGDPTVMIDGVAATNVTVVDDETITAQTGVAPGSPAFEPLDVVVSNANGADTLEDAFELTQQGLIVTENCCSNRVYYVNPTTGAAKEIRRTSRRVRGCVRTPAGTLIGNGPRASDGLMELVNFDPLTGSVNAIGLLSEGGTNRGVPSLAFVGANLFATASRNRTVCCAQTVHFMSVVPSSGALTTLSAPAVSRPNAIAAKDATSVWVIDNTNATLDTMAVSNGALSTGPTLNGPVGSVHGLAVVGGTLYAGERFGQNRIWSVNTTTGQMTEIATVPMQIGGICETPSSF